MVRVPGQKVKRARRGQHGVWRAQGESAAGRAHCAGAALHSPRRCLLPHLDTIVYSVIHIMKKPGSPTPYSELHYIFKQPFFTVHLTDFYFYCVVVWQLLAAVNSWRRNNLWSEKFSNVVGIWELMQRKRQKFFKYNFYHVWIAHFFLLTDITTDTSFNFTAH